MSDVDPKSLEGIRVLDGRGEFVVAAKRWPNDSDDNARAEVLRLDGVLYAFVEDENDGYRSSMAGILILRPDQVPPGAFVEFPPMVVTCRWIEQWDRWGAGYANECGVLYGVDEKTGLVVFEYGTDQIDDYYPSFVAVWRPDGYMPDWLKNAAEQPE